MNNEETKQWSSALLHLYISETDNSNRINVFTYFTSKNNGSNLTWHIEWQGQSKMIFVPYIFAQDNLHTFYPLSN